MTAFCLITVSLQIMKIVFFVCIYSNNEKLYFSYVQSTVRQSTINYLNCLFFINYLSALFILKSQNISEKCQGLLYILVRGMQKKLLQNTMFLEVLRTVCPCLQMINTGFVDRLSLFTNNPRLADCLSLFTNNHWFCEPFVLVYKL